MKLGAKLQNILQPGSAPDLNAGFSPAQPQRGGFLQQGGLGRILAGTIGDVLLQQSGMAPAYAPAMQQQRRIEQEEAQWNRRRMSDREDKQWEWQNKPQEQDVPPILRDAQAWMGMTPEQQAAVKQMQMAKEGDPIVNTPLPNGQFYSGPRSGLAQALAGWQAAAPPRPVGKLTPIQGGPTQPASGPFRP